MSPNHAQNLNRCLLGGTFDRFHIGHEKLITSCLDRCTDLEIWLTSDEMVKETKSNTFVIAVSYILMFLLVTII